MARRRILAIAAGLAVVCMAVVPGQARVVGGRGIVSAQGRWIGTGPVIPEGFSTLAVEAQNAFGTALPCLTKELCPPLGTVAIVDDDGSRFQARVTCLTLQGSEAFLGLLGGRGDEVYESAARVRDATRDPGPLVLDSFSLLEDRPFDCLDEQTRQELREQAVPIAPGDALVMDVCDIPTIVCAQDE